MNQHRKRLIVGIMLLVFLIPAIVVLPSMLLTAIFALLCISAIGEWGRIVNWSGEGRRQSLYIGSCVLSTLAIASFSIYYDSKLILYIAVLWWFVALVISTFYTSALCANNAFRWFLSAHIIIALAACIVAVYLLHKSSSAWLLYAVALVSLCDTAAYYVGRRFGKQKLAPTISLGKTKAGLWGALVAALILSLSSAVLLLENATVLSVISLVLLSLIACIAGVIGDLTESMAKRCAGVKDSGKLLPGHGGVLDRIDAFIAVAPVVALGISVILI